MKHTDELVGSEAEAWTKEHNKNDAGEREGHTDMRDGVWTGARLVRDLMMRRKRLKFMLRIT